MRACLFVVLAASLAACQSSDDAARERENRFVTALMANDISGMNAEVRAGLDLRAPLNDGRGRTPLMFAAYMGREKSVAHLAGVIGASDLDRMDNAGETALMLACRRGSSEAANRDHAAVVRELLSRGADPNKHGQTRTALMLAADAGNRELVKILLAAKADPRATRPGGKTAAYFSEASDLKDPAITALLRAAERRL
jgi:ankyrin repeat protein